MHCEAGGLTLIGGEQSQGWGRHHRCTPQNGAMLPAQERTINGFPKLSDLGKIGEILPTRLSNFEGSLHSTKNGSALFLDAAPTCAVCYGRSSRLCLIYINMAPECYPNDQDLKGGAAQGRGLCKLCRAQHTNTAEILRRGSMICLGQTSASECGRQYIITRPQT
jgi:hypothetical protein